MKGLTFQTCPKPAHYARDGVLTADVNYPGLGRIRDYWVRGRFYRRLTSLKRPRRETWMVLRLRVEKVRTAPVRKRPLPDGRGSEELGPLNR